MAEVKIEKVKGKKGLYSVEQTIKAPIEYILYANSTIGPNVKEDISPKQFIDSLRRVKAVKAEYGFKKKQGDQCKIIARKVRKFKGREKSNENINNL